MQKEVKSIDFDLPKKKII